MAKSPDPRAAASRRAFLSGQAAVEALGRWADGNADDRRRTETRPLPPPEPAYLLHFGRRAMACEFEVYLPAGGGQAAESAAAALAALDLVDALETQLTVYRETSEVMEVNRRAALEPVNVEPRLFALLQLCQRLHLETDGAFDVTSGPLTKAWGFFRRQGAMPTAEAITEALARVGGEKIELDASAHRVRFRQPGVEMNLGSIGKGYALDRCAELLCQRGVASFLLHGGHSSVLAKGSRDATMLSGEAGDSDQIGESKKSYPVASGGWKVGVVDPLRPDKRLAEIHLRDRALATSGSGSQFFRHAGRRYGHILDPRSGWPAENVFSATVLAPTAAEADALATAFFVLGPNRAAEYCQIRPSVSFLMVHARPGGPPEVTHGNLGEGEWRLL